jgi:hypothetical protein
MDHGLIIDDIILGTEKAQELFSCVPLGNSAFQTENFAVNHLGAARTMRQVVLELRDRSAALNKARAERERLEIRLERRARRIALLKRLSFIRFFRESARLLEIESDEDRYNLGQQKVLIEDALVKVQELLGHMNKLPKMSKAEFELQEPQYWKDRLSLEAKLQILERGSIQAGTADSMERVGIDPVEATIGLKAQIEHKFLQIGEAAKKQLEAANSRPS